MYVHSFLAVTKENSDDFRLDELNYQCLRFTIGTYN